MAIALAGLTEVTTGQQEQWLQYHSAPDAASILQEIDRQRLQATFDKPEDVDLPQFKSDKPLFARWATPMVDSGGLWMALDRTTAYGRCDLLYIDSNGDNSLADESPVTPHTQNYRSNRHSAFAPVKVAFRGKDGPITYHLRIDLYDYVQQKHLYAGAACWYEGAIDVAGEKKHCTLIDYNANGTFDDTSISPSECDRIRIGDKPRHDTRFVGKYVEVNDILYRLHVARDGAYVKLAKADDVSFGHVNLPETITEFAAGGENGLFVRKPEKGFCSLPVGKYRIDHWAIERQDEQGVQWKVQGRWFGDPGLFDVTKEDRAELSIGEPITSAVSVVRDGSTYRFSQELQGRLGESIELERQGTRPRAPQLHVKSEDGSYDRTFTFEYG